MLDIITDEMKKHCLDHSTERMVSKNFPEYHKFLTGKVEFRKAKIVNMNPVQTIDVVEEIKEGGLGDLLTVYVNLLQEEKDSNSFWGQVKANFLGVGKRFTWDRQYLIEDLKKALNRITTTW